MLKKTLLYAGMALFISTQAFASMPLVTDDTGTQGKGRFQLELGAASLRDREDVDGAALRQTGEEASAILSCGLADRVDLVATLPWSWNSIEEEGTASSDINGAGDLSLQLKWRFFESENGGVSLALRPGVTLPTGNEHLGLGNGMASGNVMLIATKSAKPLCMHLNLGYTRNEYRLESDRLASRRDIWHASLAGDLTVSAHLRVVADIGLETNPAKGEKDDPAYLIGGLIYKAADNIDLDIGVKSGLTEAETDRAILAGVTMRF